MLQHYLSSQLQGKVTEERKSLTGAGKNSGDELAWGRRGLTLPSGFQKVQSEGSSLDYFVSTK